MKKAFISGISGQDGAYLAELLLSKGYEVYGGERRSASGSIWRLDKLGISNDIQIIDFELSEFSNINNVIEKVQPDEFYNLAAQSFVGSSFEVPIMTSDVTGLGCLRVLASIKILNFIKHLLQKCLERFKQFRKMKILHFIQEAHTALLSYLVIGLQ